MRDCINSLPGACLQAVVVASLILMGCGDDDKPTAPEARQTNPMLGTWRGTLHMSFPSGGISRDPMTVVFDAGGMSLWISGEATTARLESMSSSQVRFVAELPVSEVRVLQFFNGTRAGSTINGTAEIPLVQAVGQWSVSKGSAAPAGVDESVRLIDLLTRNWDQVHGSSQ